jgi:hypothetical protein
LESLSDLLQSALENDMYNPGNEAVRLRQKVTVKHSELNLVMEQDDRDH